MCTQNQQRNWCYILFFFKFNKCYQHYSFIKNIIYVYWLGFTIIYNLIISKPPSFLTRSVKICLFLDFFWYTHNCHSIDSHPNQFPPILCTPNIFILIKLKLFFCAQKWFGGNWSGWNWPGGNCEYTSFPSLMTNH